MKSSKNKVMKSTELYQEYPMRRDTIKTPSRFIPIWIFTPATIRTALAPIPERTEQLEKYAETLFTLQPWQWQLLLLFLVSLSPLSFFGLATIEPLRDCLCVRLGRGCVCARGKTLALTSCRIQNRNFGRTLLLLFLLVYSSRDGRHNFFSFNGARTHILDSELIASIKNTSDLRASFLGNGSEPSEIKYMLQYFINYDKQ
ncbi:hypothetical protein TSAR_012910 [Trichomalopsis sarcophagae]|uniref:Uncharacterized protein n=1 Tax=Trichomalopsis sarcophagae TaxID=543379 RepID=A0A232EI91_9HYME|nr:hypothetical protein TSAR_012910 [Trichomalopsis sarcophagae]